MLALRPLHLTVIERTVSMDTAHHPHGGRIRAFAQEAGVNPAQILDFSANINPLGPPPWLAETVHRQLNAVVHYPEPSATSFRQAVATEHSIPVDHILAGNGASQLLYALPRACEPRRVLVPVPSYIDYVRAATAARVQAEPLPLPSATAFRASAELVDGALQPGDLVIVGHPATPTGALLDVDAWRELARRHPACRFLIDETYLQFEERPQSFLIDRPENVLVLRSLSNFFAIPGLRLGYLVCHPELALDVRRQLPDWSVNTFAQAVGARAIADHHYQQLTRATIRRAKDSLMRDLSRLTLLKVLPGAGNFLLCHFRHLRMTAEELADQLLHQHHIAIRPCTNIEGLDAQYIRVAVRTPADNAKLANALRELID